MIASPAGLTATVTVNVSLTFSDCVVGLRLTLAAPAASAASNEENGITLYAPASAKVINNSAPTLVLFWIFLNISPTLFPKILT